MHVIVDDREPQDGVAFHLRQMEDVIVVTDRLAVGDYLVGRRVLFERKTRRDFTLSLVDGRLFTQAYRMKQGFLKPAYILEGAADDVGCGVHRECLQGALITLQLVMGIPILYSTGIKETAQLIRYTAHQIEKQSGVLVYHTGRRPTGKRKRQLYILQSLPGIGPLRAKRLLDTFGSVRSVILADKEALAQTEGIGYKTATAILDMLS